MSSFPSVLATVKRVRKKKTLRSSVAFGYSHTLIRCMRMLHTPVVVRGGGREGACRLPTSESLKRAQSIHMYLLTGKKEPLTLDSDLWPLAI